MIEQPVFYNDTKEFYLYTQSLEFEYADEFDHDTNIYDIREIDHANIIVSVIEHSFQSETIYKDSFTFMILKLTRQYFRIPIIVTSIALTITIILYCYLLIKLLILEPINEIIDLILNP